MFTKTLLSTVALATLAFARTDLAGCTSSADGSRLVWWVPGTGEICSIPDCGGGRAPLKTTVPGCAAYIGTETYQPSYLPGWGPEGPISTEAPLAITTAAYPTLTGFQQAGETSSVEQYPQSSKEEDETTLATITSAPHLTAYPTWVGTGSSTLVYSKPSNVTGNATLTTGPAIPEHTGAANLKAVQQGLLGVAAGVVGLAIL